MMYSLNFYRVGCFKYRKYYIVLVQLNKFIEKVSVEMFV